MERGTRIKWQPIPGSTGGTCRTAVVVDTSLAIIFNSIYFLFCVLYFINLYDVKTTLSNAEILLFICLFISVGTASGLSLTQDSQLASSFNSFKSCPSAWLLYPINLLKNPLISSTPFDVTDESTRSIGSS